MVTCEKGSSGELTLFVDECMVGRLYCNMLTLNQRAKTTYQNDYKQIFSTDNNGNMMETYIIQPEKEGNLSKQSRLDNERKT